MQSSEPGGKGGEKKEQDYIYKYRPIANKLNAKAQRTLEIKIGCISKNRDRC